MKRLILSILLISALLFTSTAAWAADSGDGKIPLTSAEISIESGKTYTISTKEELLNFASIVNNGNTCAGVTIELLSDIAVYSGTFSADDTPGKYNLLYNGAPLPSDPVMFYWVPIGNHLAKFSGTFEGNSHTISGLYYDFTSGGNMALFGNCSGAVIRNVTVSNAYFSGASCGGICVNLTDGGRIENCHSSATIVSRDYGAGIAVFASGSSTISNCTNSGRILGGDADNPNSTFEGLGGIAGICQNSSIINCVNKGEVRGTISIGTILGEDKGGSVLTNCTNEGTATGVGFINRLIGNKEETGTHVHVFGSAYSYDEKGHYFTCDCGAHSKSEPHQFDKTKDWIALKPTVFCEGSLAHVCSICKGNVTEPIPPTGSYTLEHVNGQGADVSIDRDDIMWVELKSDYVLIDVIRNGVSLGPASSFAISDGDHIKLVYYNNAVGAKAAALKTGIEKTTISLTSTLGKGYIKLSWKKSAGYKVDYYEVFRSLKKNSGYGAKAFYRTTNGNKLSYKNTKQLKKGTRYYFKVRGVRVIDGKKYYTQYSNKTWRTAR